MNVRKDNKSTKKLSERNKYLISSLFFPILAVVYIGLSMLYTYQYTWIIFPIGLNLYLYLIDFKKRYILLLDAIILLVFLYFYLWVLAFGFEKNVLALILLYAVFLVIMLVIKQMKLKYILWPSVVLCYFVVSIVTNLWMITWIIFPVVSVLQSYKYMND